MWKTQQQLSSVAEKWGGLVGIFYKTHLFAVLLKFSFPIFGVSQVFGGGVSDCQDGDSRAASTVDGK